MVQASYIISIMYRNSRLSEKQDSEMKSLSGQLMSEIQASEQSSWLKVKKIILRILVIVPQLPTSLVSDIRYQIKQINSFFTLLFIYGQEFRELRESYYFRQQYKSITNKKNFYENIYKWMASQPQQVLQQTVELVVQTLPSFFEKDMLIITHEDLHLLLSIFNLFKLKSDREMNRLMVLIGKLQKIKINSVSSLGIKELDIAKVICSVLQKEQGTGNLGILFDELLIGPLQSKNIQKFASVQSQYILNLPVEKLQRIFKGLCKVGINCIIVDLIYRASRILANQEQFYKLSYLFQKFILPQVALRAKTSRKPKVDYMVLTLTEFYFYGFFVYYKLEQSALQCLLTNIQHIKNKEVQNRWIWLCIKAAQKNQSKTLNYFLNQQFQKKNLDKSEISSNQCQKVIKKYQVWQITPRNIRNLKKYNYELSTTLKGIVNFSCQCYIISIVQAFFMTKSLAKLLQKAKPKFSGNRVIDHLQKLFDELSSDSKRLPSVNDLKQDGPKQFAISQNQEDAQNYLIILLQRLQEQFKKQNLLKEFKEVFQIESKDNVICNICRNQKNITQNQYARTFAHGEQFVLQRSQNLIDYKCDKCGKKQCKKTTTISLNSEIVILHINRFSSRRGASKKQLPTQKIKRRINNHELVGIVFHIGKTMESGHYTYFSRLSKKRWAQMNDKQVFQFDLEHEDEEFQKEFKAQKTPYILFYKKVT